MNINKAIIKQKKSYKRFLLIMGFIFFALPIALVITKETNVFYIVYLALIETLIIIAIIRKINNENLKIFDECYKIKVVSGIKKESLTIICNKVALVHVEEKDFSVVIIATAKFRNKKVFPISEKFLKNHGYIAHYYNKMKILNPEKDYFYVIIKRGKYLKYKLLDIIYKNCVYAYFTDETIEKIKEYRNEVN